MQTFDVAYFSRQGQTVILVIVGKRDIQNSIEKREGCPGQGKKGKTAIIILNVTFFPAFFPEGRR